MEEIRPRRWRQRLRAIFFFLLWLIPLWGIIDVFTTVGVVDAKTLTDVLGATSTALKTDPIANIHLIPRCFALLITILPAIVYPLGGYLLCLFLSIMGIIDNIRDLLRPS